MKSLYFFWYYLNWLEFVTYVLIPSAMILVILTYIFFNIELLRFALNLELDILDKKKIFDLEKKSH